jgi:hypothetical protein
MADRQVQSCFGRLLWFPFVFVLSSLSHPRWFALVHTHAISLFKPHNKYVVFSFVFQTSGSFDFLVGQNIYTFSIS